MDCQILENILEELRMEESDNRIYEVKNAAKGMPQTILNTMCAFANTPGGGTLILGIDENLEFEAVGVYDAKVCQQTLGSYAKTEFSTMLEMSLYVLRINDKKIVVAEISEAVRSLKPVHIRKNRKAYIRLYDGDYELSEQDKQLFVNARGPSLFDEEPVKGSSISDLNNVLVKQYITNRKAHSPILSKMGDEEILIRTGILTNVGEVTAAGIISLGIYPQQYFPNYTIKVSSKKENDNSSIRASNVNSIDGPIPIMLATTLEWLTKNSDELTISTYSGQVRNVLEYPIAAMRELVANALIHRDLNPLSMFENISLKIENQQLILSNPGGLYGITLSELGQTGSRTRNVRLAEICQFVQTEDGANVIEKLGSGIPKVINEMSILDMPTPRFIDGGIYFTVIMDSIYKKSASSQDIYTRNNNCEKVIMALVKGPLSKAEIEGRTQLSSAQTRYALSKLIKDKSVYKLGNKTGVNVRYALIDE
jgi:ATP-dependent DNA helicase RecG